jgi:hypothetical protein
LRVSKEGRKEGKGCCTLYNIKAGFVALLDPLVRIIVIKCALDRKSPNRVFLLQKNRKRMLMPVFLWLLIDK